MQIPRSRALLLAALIGCGGTTEPAAARLAGTWMLQSVDGVELPVPVTPWPGEVSRRLTGGQLVLGDEESYRTESFRYVHQSPRPY